MRQLDTKILYNRKVAEGFYEMRLDSSYLAKNSKPGQFVEVRCSDSFDPLLRRPLGVHRIHTDGIELLYEVVGRGTEILSKRKPGEDLDIIGPLGNGFTLNRPTGKPANRQTILAAGGIGVAPLLALAEKLAYSVERIAYRKKEKNYVLIGACTKGHILCAEDFKKLGYRVLVATEDGSRGHKGLVTDMLRKIVIARHEVPKQSPFRLLRRRFAPPRNDGIRIYACGPHAMLKEIAKVAAQHKIPCQVSLEERMACGVGVCLGCPVRVRQFSSSLVRPFRGTREQTNKRTDEQTNYVYKMVCKDGPIFDAEEIAW